MTEQVLSVLAESAQSTAAEAAAAVVVDNITDTDVAELMVQSIMGLDNSSYTLEMIPEISAAVVTFSNAAGGWRRPPAGDRCC